MRKISEKYFFFCPEGCFKSINFTHYSPHKLWHVNAPHVTHQGTTHVIFCINTTMTSPSLPPSVTHLTFAREFNFEIAYPPSLTFLKFGYRFNKPLDNLPHSLTHLIFGDSFHQPSFTIPPQLTHLVFGTKFNYVINHFPPTLQKLKFGQHFNQPIDLAPLVKLTHLSFGYYFDHPIEHFPISLTHLSFGYSFSHPIDNLPSLVKLKLGYTFDHNVNLPVTLTDLTLAKPFLAKVEFPPKLSRLFLLRLNATTTDTLPSSITYLYLNCTQYAPIYPPNLTHLFVSISHSGFVRNAIQHLPLTLITLHIIFPVPIKLLTIELPPKLEKLDTRNLIFPPMTFPESLRHFTIATPLQSFAHLTLPNITFFRVISFSSEKISEVPHYYPPSLTHLVFGGTFNLEIPPLPHNLTHIYFGNSFDKPLQNLPASLLFIRFGENFDQPIKDLPDSIEYLEMLCARYSNSLEKLPKALKHFIPPQRRSLPKLPPHVRVHTKDCAMDLLDEYDALVGKFKYKLNKSS